MRVSFSFVPTNSRYFLSLLWQVILEKRKKVKERKERKWGGSVQTNLHHRRMKHVPSSSEAEPGFLGPDANTFGEFSLRKLIFKSNENVDMQMGSRNILGSHPETRLPATT